MAVIDMRKKFKVGQKVVAVKGGWRGAVVARVIWHPRSLF